LVFRTAPVILRVLADRKPMRARFLVLGSAAPELLRQASESLAGRIEMIALGASRWMRSARLRSTSTGDAVVSLDRFSHALNPITLRDSGLLHELLGIRSQPELLGHPKLGASFEGYAIEQTLHVMQPDEAYFWATHQGAELDLLLFQGRQAHRSRSQTARRT
jgi:predicted AAA+ superfamily ATPase